VPAISVAVPTPSQGAGNDFTNGVSQAVPKGPDQPRASQLPRATSHSIPGNLFQTIPAAPRHAALTVPVTLPAATGRAGDGYFTSVSQGLAKNQATPTVSAPPPTPSYSTSENSEATDHTSDVTGKSQTTDAHISKIKGQQPSPAPINKEDSVDASVLSTIVASLTPPTVSPLDNGKPVPAQGNDFKVAPEQGGWVTGQFNDSGGQASPQKLSVPTVEPPTAVPANEAGTAVSKPPTPSVLKPLIDSGKPIPPNISPTGNESAPAAPNQQPASIPQLTASQDVPLPAQEILASAVPIDGTGAALNHQRMKFGSEKNEIAGRAVQKMPDASPAADLSSNVIGKVNAKSDANLSLRGKDSFDPGLVIDAFANSRTTDVIQGKFGENSQPPDIAAAQVERVAHLVNQEVLMVRQSGANSLAVSLKVDSHTELFLQLTNHDGQIQASVRCERGDVEALGTHWGDLQESLARQNVQLMPLEDRNSSRNSPTLNPPAGTTSSRTFDQPSQNQRQQYRDSRDEPSLAGVARAATPSRKTRTSIRSRQNFETWA
jgi:hypothetical protein